MGQKPRIVIKLGGSVLCNPQAYAVAAEFIKRLSEYYDIVAVVVSAMKGETDRLYKLYNDVIPKKTSDLGNIFRAGIKQGLARVVASGEEVSAGLLAGCLNFIGVKAKSYNAREFFIFAKKNRIINILAHVLIQKNIKKHIISIVTGFQAIENDNLVLLERGGSDISAVAIACWLPGVDFCLFVKEGGGIYDEEGNEIKCISYDDVLKIIQSRKHKVLHPDCVELAKMKGLPLFISDMPHFPDVGTWIASQEVIDSVLQQQLQHVQ